MKTENLLILAALGAGAYYFITKPKGEEAVTAPSPNPQNAFTMLPNFLPSGEQILGAEGNIVGGLLDSISSIFNPQVKQSNAVQAAIARGATPYVPTRGSQAQEIIRADYYSGATTLQGAINQLKTLKSFSTNVLAAEPTAQISTLKISTATNPVKAMGGTGTVQTATGTGYLFGTNGSKVIIAPSTPTKQAPPANPNVGQIIASGYPNLSTWKAATK